MPQALLAYSLAARKITVVDKICFPIESDQEIQYITNNGYNIRTFPLQQTPPPPPSQVPEFPTLALPILSDRAPVHAAQIEVGAEPCTFQDRTPRRTQNSQRLLRLCFAFFANFAVMSFNLLKCYGLISHDCAGTLLAPKI